MTGFIRKAVAVEAVAIPAGGPLETPAWLTAALWAGTVGPANDGTMKVHTRLGTLTVNPGDWIILGPKGELDACSAAYFADLYGSAP
ncbi:MAG TPA: hypothetical protein VFC47_11320 [Caulobacteraceae bacterium]|nr:hypothetical protein [Caulobacteraceae bacterium]